MEISNLGMILFQNHVSTYITDWKDDYAIISDVWHEGNFSYAFWVLSIFVTSINIKSNKCDF